MFDPSAPHIIILLVVVLLLFGSSRLPGAARSLGKSMHIFRNSVKGMEADDAGDEGAGYTQATVLPPVQQQLTAQSDPSQQAQIDELQRQLAELQRTSAAGNGAGAQASEPSPSSSSSQPS